MRALAFVLVLFATPLDASTRRMSIDSARYASAWAHVQECSGRSPLPGHELTHLVILAEPSVLVDGHRILARWVLGDTIFIDATALNSGWVIDHELLHALLQGPALEAGGPHPLEPFAFPCHLMPFQHTPGGIMGSHS